MLTTFYVIAFLMLIGSILGNVDPAATPAAPAQDEDEQELIASVGDGVVEAAPAKEDDEPEPESTDEQAQSEGDGTEVVGTAAATDPDPAAPAEPQGTVPAGSGSDDSGQVPAPVAPRPPAAGTAPVAAGFKLEPDEMDRRFDAAILALDADDMLTDAQKEAEKLNLETQREARNERRQAQAIAAEDTFRNAEATRLGVTRAVLDASWEQACKDSVKLQGDLGASRALFQQRIAAVKTKAKPGTAKPTTAAQAKPTPPKPAAPTPITRQGARVAPPPASVPAPPRNKSDEEELVDSVRREQKSGVRL